RHLHDRAYRSADRVARPAFRGTARGFCDGLRAAPGFAYVHHLSVRTHVSTSASTFVRASMSREPNDHFDGVRFRNPGGAPGQRFSQVPRMLREPRTPWPVRIDQPTRQPAALNGSAAVVTFIGHSTFLIQTAAGNLLTDPIYSDRAGPLNQLGPRRVRPPAGRFQE